MITAETIKLEKERGKIVFLYYKKSNIHILCAPFAGSFNRIVYGFKGRVTQAYSPHTRILVAIPDDKITSCGWFLDRKTKYLYT